MQIIMKAMLGSLLALSVANAVAGNLYIYESKNGKALLTNVSKPSGSFDKTKHKVKVTYHKNDSSTSNATYTNASYNALNSLSNTSTSKDNSKQSLLEFEVPDGYRLPTKADNIDDWKRFDAPNYLKADFNGDGIEDEAYILPKKNSKLGYGVFVSINKTKAGIQSGRKVQLFKLTADNDMQPQSFAIELAKPSNKILKTACGKGYWDCELGEPAEFKVTKPSIMFCYIESSCTMYVWDKDKLSFKEIPFSD